MFGAEIFYPCWRLEPSRCRWYCHSLLAPLIFHPHHHLPSPSRTPIPHHRFLGMDSEILPAALQAPCRIEQAAKVVHYHLCLQQQGRGCFCADTQDNLMCTLLHELQRSSPACLCSLGCRLGLQVKLRNTTVGGPGSCSHYAYCTYLLSCHGIEGISLQRLVQ